MLFSVLFCCANIVWVFVQMELVNVTQAEMIWFMIGVFLNFRNNNIYINQLIRFQ